MSVSASATTPTAAPPPEPAAQRLPAAQLDASCRGPVLFFFGSAMVWVIIGLLFAVITSIKFHGPGMLADIPWLTVGRTRAASMNALLYGFGFQAALGVMLWMICRLGGMVLLNRSLILLAGALWNFGVTAGLFLILAGHSTGFQWLEMPRWVAFFLFASYALIGLWALITLHYRRERTLYVSQWYLLGALFWFPWIYSAAIYLLLVKPVRGVMQSTVNCWYTSNLLNLWFLPIALATIYYFLPKLARRPLYSRGLAVFAFWTYILFAGWTAFAQSVGGPWPVWMISASIGANLILFVPLICVAANWYLTLAGDYSRLKENLTLRCVVFAAGAYVVGGLESILIGNHMVGPVTEFTYVPVAWTQLMFLGVFGMAMFGAMYYIVPRLAQLDWPSPRVLRTHFLCTAGGVTLYFLALTAAGLVQGLRLQDPSVDFLRAVKSAVPFVGISTLALLLLLYGQAVLAMNLFRLFGRLCTPVCQGARVLLAAATSAKTEVKP